MLSDKVLISRISPRWGQERRLEFIDFRLLWERTVNRGELIEFFGISAQQASADLARYQELAPGNIIYNTSRKRYETGNSFSPKFIQPSANGYLQLLLERQVTDKFSPGNFIGWTPETDIVVSPTRNISETALAQLLWVMRYEMEIEITYQSLRLDQPERIWIAPHAFGFDGTRWHTRAWSFKRATFADFVLSRIQIIHATRPGAVISKNDQWWHEYIELHIRPKSTLTESQRISIAKDFGMKNGQLSLRSRKAMAFYVLRSLRLEEDRPKASIDQPLELINRSELQDILAAGHKSPPLSS